MASLGRYELVRLLARGGMGEVFLARRRSGAGVEKRVVVKRIHPERARDPETVALFVREARISMALSHQNIVPVFDFGRAGDALFLAMDYVEGTDLATLLSRLRERGEHLDPTLVAFIGAECCAALAYAHNQRFADGTVGVVHRDVTPRNILLSSAGEVRLLDFGIAIVRHDPASAIRGTLQYMAPEQARGDAVDGRADLFALGVALIEAANGERARTLVGDEALVQARAGIVPTPHAHVPAALATALGRATARATDDRFPDARSMREALERVVVTARAEHPDAPPPSRALAELLRDELASEAPTSESPPAPMDAVTFLDHGVEAVLGSATARSLALTIDAIEPPATPPPEPSPVIAPTALPARWLLLAVAFALVSVALVALVWRLSRDDAAAPAPPPVAIDAASVVIDAAPVALDASTPTIDAAPADAAPALPIDAGRARPPVAIDAARPALDAAAAAVLVDNVTIQARPWAEFYVDDEPQRHETPETITLSPGRHRIRFVNPPAHIDRTIELDVPADRRIKHVEVLVADP